MRRICIALILLSMVACQQDRQVNTCSLADKKQDPFNEEKVHLSQIVPGQGEQVALGSEIIQPGQPLVAIMNDACLAEDASNLRGAITSQLATTEHYPTPSGEQAYEFTLPFAVSVAELKQIADEDACLIGISNDSIAYAPSATARSPSDPHYAKQDHLRAVEARSAYQAPSFSKPAPPRVTVAIIDTGIDLNHEDLRGVLWQNDGEIPGNRIDDDRNGYVDDVHGYNFASRKPSPAHEATWNGYHHGTHVAGLAAAQTFNGRGVAGAIGQNARIMALNVFGKRQTASSSTSANAIRYAADNGANVINLSLGGVGRSAAYESAIRYAVGKGVVVLAAAGNESQRISNSYFLTPAAYAPTIAGMISVGSIDSATTAYSSFSNYGANYVELASPGAERTRGLGLLSTLPNQKYGRAKGTSMATPVAAGIAAAAIQFLKARGYQPNAAAVEQILRNSSLKYTQLSAKVRNGSVINTRKMIEYISKNYPARTNAGGLVETPVSNDEDSFDDSEGLVQDSCS